MMDMRKFLKGAAAGFAGVLAALRLAAAPADGAMAKLEALAHDCEASGKPELVERARHARHFRHWTAKETESAALVELETLWLCRGLEEALGRTPSPIAVPAADAPASDPPPANLVSFKPHKVGFGQRADLGDGFGFAFPEGGRRVVLSLTRDGKLEKDAWPGGVLSVRLWIPGDGKGRWILYPFELDLGPRTRKPLADRTTWYTRYFGVERRFEDPARGPRLTFGKSSATRKTRPPLAIPEIYGWTIERGGDRWTLTAEIDMFDFCGHWPMLDPAKRDEAWYLEMSYGGATAKAKIAWARGSSANLFVYAKGLAWWTLTSRYENARSKAYWRWDEEDPLFSSAVLDPMVAENANLAKVCASTGWQNPAKIVAESDAVKKLVLPQVGRLAGFAEAVEAARFKYLCDCIAGRKIEPPKAPVAEKKTEKGPALESEGETLQLDDVEF